MIIEPCIVPPLLDTAAGASKELLARWIVRATSVGYDGFGLDLSHINHHDNIFAIIDQFNKENKDFTILTRKTIQLDDQRQLKARLSGIRNRAGADLIVVRSTSTEVLNFVAKDSRIDIIKIENQSEFEAFTEGVASLAGQQGTFIELSFLPLLISRGSSRSKYIHSCNKIIEITLEKHARLLISCDAVRLTDIKNAWQKAVTLELLLSISKQMARNITIANTNLLFDKLKDKISEREVVQENHDMEEAAQ